jgi:hypothetical protein
VHSIYAAWERGEYSSVAWAHPEIEFGSADGPDPGISTGLAAMMVVQSVHAHLAANSQRL